MEESKYYTPEIEELYCGFPYEQKKSNGAWVPSEVAFNLAKNKSYLDQGRLRVKYLDQGDIESLGFKRIISREGWMMYQSGEFTIRIKDGEDNLLRIFKEHHFDLLGEALFRGVIKNKSELKRVLKQIGYENS